MKLAHFIKINNYNIFRYFKIKKLNTNSIVAQEFFLNKMGSLKRAEILSKKMNFQEKSKTYYSLLRLLNSKQMGELFKVIFAFKLGKKFSTGFI